MKLKAVIVDDDPEVFPIIKDLCKNSSLVEISYTFTNPVEFLKVASTLDFDVALLDIQMENMLGTQVAQKLNNKTVIFVTGAFDYLKDAIRIPYADVVLKPIEKHLFDAAIEKAHIIICSKLEKPEHRLFSSANVKNKVKLCIRDIFLVITDDVNPRHKHLIMKEGQQYEITDCNLEELLELSPYLLQANKSELVSIEAVEEIMDNYSTIRLKCIKDKGQPKRIILSRSFKKSFLAGICSK